MGRTLTGLAAMARRRMNSKVSGSSIGRQRVGAGDHGGHAAGRGGGAGGAEALLVALARLADLDADVDDAGGEAFAVAVEAGARAFEDLRDAAVVADNEAAVEDAVALGVDQAGVGEGSGHLRSFSMSACVARASGKYSSLTCLNCPIRRYRQVFMRATRRISPN